MPGETHSNGFLDAGSGNLHGFLARNRCLSGNEFAIRAGDREPRQRLAIFADESAVSVFKFQDGFVADHFHLLKSRAFAGHFPVVSLVQRKQGETMTDVQRGTPAPRSRSYRLSGNY